MKFIWLGFLLEIIILSLMRPVITDYNAVGVIAALLHITFTMIILMSYKTKEKILLLTAFGARVIFLLWDLYARNIYVLPNSGADSEMFYSASIRIADNLSLLGSTGEGVFPKIMGILFTAIGPQRIVGQYINVLLGLSLIFVIYRILNILNVSQKVSKLVIIIACFFPNSIIMSAIFLREMIPTFFVAVSLYYFVKWFKTLGYLNIVLAFIMLAIASMFHSGVIGISIGYIFAFLFYKKEKKKFEFSTRTLISFVIIIIVFSLGYKYLGDKIFFKFRNVDDISDIYDTANSRLGGSAYLTSLKINNLIQLIAFGPLKIFYFFTAPLPMNWRGFMDIFTFFSDSLLYLLTILYLLKNRKFFGNRKTIIVCLIWMIVGAAIIYGIGVSNAGTAMRHRQKLIPLFLVLLGVMMDGKRKNSIGQNSV